MKLFSLFFVLSSILLSLLFVIPSLIFADPISQSENQTITTGEGVNGTVGTGGSVTTTTTTTTSVAASPGAGGTGSSAGGGGAAATTTATAAPVVETKKIASAVAGSTISVNITKSADLKIDEIKIDVKNAVSNVEIQIKESSAPVGNFAIASEVGATYKYLEITKANITDADISGVTIKFKVEKSWISANGIDPNTIKLKRLVGSTWTDLPTTKTSEDATYIYFEATSPGLSLFAITGEKVKAATTTTTATTTTAIIPPLPAIPAGAWYFLALVVVLVVVAFVLRKRKIV